MNTADRKEEQARRVEDSIRDLLCEGESRLLYDIAEGLIRTTMQAVLGVNEDMMEWPIPTEHLRRLYQEYRDMAVGRTCETCLYYDGDGCTVDPGPVVPVPYHKQMCCKYQFVD